MQYPDSADPEVLLQRQAHSVRAGDTPEVVDWPLPVSRLLLLLRPCGALPNCRQREGADIKKTMSALHATTPSSAYLCALLPEGQSVISSVDYQGDRLRGPAGSRLRRLSGPRLS